MTVSLVPCNMSHLHYNLHTQTGPFISNFPQNYISLWFYQAVSIYKLLFSYKLYALRSMSLSKQQYFSVRLSSTLKMEAIMLLRDVATYFSRYTVS